MKKYITFLSLLVMVALSPLASAQSDEPKKEPETVKEQNQSLVALPSIAPVVSKAQAAVVNVITTKIVKSHNLRRGPQFNNSPYDEFFDQFFGFPDSGPPKDRRDRAQGSGFIFDPEGYIITNDHVVDGADNIKVKLVDGKEITATVIGRDAKTDLALIKLDKAGPYPYISLGHSDELNIGDWLVAIGNPFGLEHTVTAGILSARSRSIGAGPYDDYLQTDASINPGNSGGPLLNLNGEVVGINTAIISGGTGIGFAIPSDMARDIINKLKSSGQVVRGWIGVLIQPITPEMVQSFGLDEVKGALVSDVVPDAPASEAGLKHGDIILDFDGKPIKIWQELPRVVAATEVGKKVKVTVFRKGKSDVLTLTVGKLDDDGQGGVSASGADNSDLGLTLREITPEMAARLGLKESGLLVENVNSDSIAAESGVQPRDVILEVNGQPVKKVQDFYNIVKSNPKDQPILIWLKRGEQTLYYSFNLS